MLNASQNELRIRKPAAAPGRTWLLRLVLFPDASVSCTPCLFSHWCGTAPCLCLCVRPFVGFRCFPHLLSSSLIYCLSLAKKWDHTSSCSAGAPATRFTHNVIDTPSLSPAPPMYTQRQHSQSTQFSSIPGSLEPSSVFAPRLKNTSHYPVFKKAQRDRRLFFKLHISIIHVHVHPVICPSSEPRVPPDCVL